MHRLQRTWQGIKTPTGATRSAARAGEVFVSGGVRQLVAGKRYDFQDLGEQSIKGFDEPLRVWQLDSQGSNRRADGR